MDLTFCWFITGSFRQYLWCLFPMKILMWKIKVQVDAFLDQRSNETDCFASNWGAHHSQLDETNCSLMFVFSTITARYVFCISRWAHQVKHMFKLDQIQWWFPVFFSYIVAPWRHSSTPSRNLELLQIIFLGVHFLCCSSMRTTFVFMAFWLTAANSVLWNRSDHDGPREHPAETLLPKVREQGELVRLFFYQ